MNASAPASQKLTAAESAGYERRAVAGLRVDCARWLATGEGLA